MRVVVSEFISLDGITQAPGGPEEDTDGGFRHGGWSGQFFEEDVIGAAWGALAERSDALLEGWRTWQISGPAWSGQSGDPFSDWINGVQKYVVSDTLTEADTAAWTPTTIIRPANLVAEVSATRERSGGDITVLGSRGRSRPDGRRPGRRAAADLGADRAGRRQEHLPLRHRGTSVRTRLDDVGQHRRPGLQLCPGLLTRTRGSPAEPWSTPWVVDFSRRISNNRRPGVNGSDSRGH